MSSVSSLSQAGNLTATATGARRYYSVASTRKTARHAGHEQTKHMKRLDNAQTGRGACARPWASTGYCAMSLIMRLLQVRHIGSMPSRCKRLWPKGDNWHLSHNTVIPDATAQILTACVHAFPPPNLGHALRSACDPLCVLRRPWPLQARARRGRLFCPWCGWAGTQGRKHCARHAES